VTAKRHDDDDPAAGSPLTVEVAVDDTDLAERVRTMLSDAHDMSVVDAGWPPAQVRITVGTGDPAAPALVLAGGGAGEPLDAMGVVSADVDAPTLRAAIRAIARGLAVFSPRFHRAAAEDFDPAAPQSAEDEDVRVALTPRELEVLQLLSEGASNKVIARHLDITPHTAKFHVASIVAKLGATGRTDAVAKAMRSGLLMI
jgi:DNA-binding NarL/FixJ family response regulator